MKQSDYDLKRQKAHPTVVKLKKCPRCGFNRLHPSDKFCFNEECNWPGPTMIERIRQLEQQVEELNRKLERTHEIASRVHMDTLPIG